MSSHDVVTKALDEHVAALEEERLPDMRWHPSSLWTCARSAVMGHRAIPPTNIPDSQAKRVFRIGHMYHALVQEALGLSPDFVNVYAEFGISIDLLGIVGNGDVLVEFGDGHWEVFELKSTKSLKYTPKLDHLRQASVYFTAARDFGFEVEDEERPLETAKEGCMTKKMPPLGDKLTAIRLIYLNKQDLEIREYVYEYDPQWRIDIEARINYLDSLADLPLDELPLLNLHDKSVAWYPDYCPYKGSGNCCGDRESKETLEW